MTEVTILRCDGPDCQATVEAFPEKGSPEQTRRDKWERDDMDSDFCPDCQEAKKQLDASLASGEDVSVFAELVGAEADKADAAAKAQGLKKPAPELVNVSVIRDDVLEEVVSEMVKKLTSAGVDQVTIDASVAMLRERAAEQSKTAKKKK